MDKPRAEKRDQSEYAVNQKAADADPEAWDVDHEAAQAARRIIRGVEQMTVQQRVELFECLSHDAAWVRRSAIRIR